MPLYGYDASINRASSFHLASLENSFPWWRVGATRWSECFLLFISFFFFFFFLEKSYYYRRMEGEGRGEDRSVSFAYFQWCETFGVALWNLRKRLSLPPFSTPFSSRSPLEYSCFPRQWLRFPLPFDSLPFLPRIEMINRRDDPLWSYLESF